MKAIRPYSNYSTYSKLIGLYWYCSDYHTGQWSWQYRVLSTSKYRPGPLVSGIDSEDDYEAFEYYHKLVSKFSS